MVSCICCLETNTSCPVKSLWGWHSCRTRDKPPGGTCSALLRFAQRAGNAPLCPPRHNRFPFANMNVQEQKNCQNFAPPLITCRLRAPRVLFQIFPMNYGMFYRTIFFFFFCMKVLDTKELLYSVYVKYYNNVLLKKKRFTNISLSVETS